MYGIKRFVAVINPPQAAILAVGELEPRPVVRDGEVVVRTIMELTLSCDHRILYGADAAEFLAKIREYLENAAAARALASRRATVLGAAVGSSSVDGVTPARALVGVDEQAQPAASGPGPGRRRGRGRPRAARVVGERRGPAAYARRAARARSRARAAALRAQVAPPPRDRRPVDQPARERPPRRARSSSAVPA